MNDKVKRVLIIGFAILLSVIFYQNLTPVELRETLHVAIEEQEKTAEVIQGKVRGPASVEEGEVQKIEIVEIPKPAETM